MTFNGNIVEIPIGNEGLTGNKNLSTVRPTQLLEANNISYSTGTITKEGGSAKYNASAITGTPAILGGTEYYPTTGTQRIVILADDGKLYKDTDTTFSVTLKSGLTVSDVIPDFVVGGKEAAANNTKLFCFTGKNVVQVLSADGATTSDITSPPTDWTGATQPTGGVIHEGRLWGWGNSNDPHRVYASLPTDHEDFTSTALNLSVYPGEGEKLVAGISFKGFLIMFKYPRGVYAIDTTSPTVSDWKIKKLSTHVGSLNARTVVQVVEDVVFLDRSGSIHSLSSTDEFGDVKTSNVSTIVDMDEYARDNFSTANMANAQGIYYADKSEVQFSVPDAGSTTNSRMLVLDLSSQTAKFRVSDKDAAIGLWLWTDTSFTQIPMAGDAAGFVWKLDQSSLTKDGVGYNAQFQTPHLDLSHTDPRLSVINKRGKFLELVVEPLGNWDMSIDVLWDGDIEDTYQFSMGSTGATLGSFILGTDVLGAAAIANRKRRITGGGRRISLIGRNSGAGEGFSIAKILLHYVPGDQGIRDG